jgi:hypothetical protein
MILILDQRGRSCNLWRAGRLHLTGGRIAVKAEALRLAKEPGARLFNVKKGGKLVPVPVS